MINFSGIDKYQDVTESVYSIQMKQDMVQLSIH